MIFYKHFIGDYQRKTNRLSILEDGVYPALAGRILRQRIAFATRKRRVFSYRSGNKTS